MMTEEKVERIIHDAIKAHKRKGFRTTHISVHPDYHLLVSSVAARHGLYLVIDEMLLQDKFMFKVEKE